MRRKYEQASANIMNVKLNASLLSTSTVFPAKQALFPKRNRSDCQLGEADLSHKYIYIYTYIYIYIYDVIHIYMCILDVLD